ncbi:LysR substrate-binding domain-containing protein [Saccharothrix luteola]|uniref:LysR substrate-binding domain-containing protein n=1 Tax=Saccharothrix luteola TaxID=2893018 RepID=UPI001E62A9ED|nr:LysR substrate-binding domain-containing protein [Saccharothrix luteola]MCC8246802.1 LysR family transcriptional regulator [Saccharothrix luteola]
MLLDQARIALDALRAAGRRAQRAAEPKLVLAVKADGDAGLLETILAGYAGDPASSLPVAVRVRRWGEQAGLLRQGEADATLIYEPFDRTGLDAETVERHVAAVPTDHPLAARGHATLAELGLPIDDATRLDQLHRHLDGIVARHDVHDLPPLLKLVELGELVTLLPESVVGHHPRAGIAYLDVPDTPPATLSIAWCQQARSTATAALVRAAAR